jgi:hypothetical protein
VLGNKIALRLAFRRHTTSILNHPSIKSSRVFGPFVCKGRLLQQNQGNLTDSFLEVW